MQHMILGKTVVTPSMLRAIAVSAALISLAGLAGCSTTASNDTFDLSGVSVAPPAGRAATSGRQILVPPPTALKALDSENILIRTSPSEIQYLANSQWSDSLTRMVQSKLVEAFENSGRLGGVGKPGQGLAIDYQVVTDIRAFEVQVTGGARAHVEISVKVLNDRNGTVRAQQVFSATAPVSGAGGSNYVKALDKAYSSVSTQIVNWTLGVL